LLTLSWPTLREGSAHEHHQALALTFDGTLIDEMSFQMLLSEDSSITRVAAKSAAKPTYLT